MLSALTIFCGAFLLFLVQPLIGKYLLPWFGGGTGVWTVCLLFFQLILLGGYAYAHLLTTKFRPRQQAVLHSGLLIASLVFLPIIPGASWKPTGLEEPTIAILLLLLATVGLPCLVLSASGPLLQRWFTLTRPGASPYRLYALSNAGSLLALVAYPFGLEPLWSRSTQAWIWSVGLMVFAALAAACAWRVSRVPHEPAAREAAGAGSESVAWRIPLGWVAWPALASLLLAAVTAKLTLEVAPVPFLWLVPLAVYLLSFIVCFDRPHWYARGTFAALLALGCGLVAALLRPDSSATMPIELAVYLPLLFAACMVCHGEVYRLRPAPAHLTRFYLCLAAGGATGSLFAAVIAPWLFNDYHELPLGLCGVLAFVAVVSWARRERAMPLGLAIGTAAAFALGPLLPTAILGEGAGAAANYGSRLHALAGPGGWIPAAGVVIFLLCFHERWRRPVARAWRPGMAIFGFLLAGAFAAVFFSMTHVRRDGMVAASRNFYGTLRVRDTVVVPSVPDRLRLFYHGAITHGAQFLTPSRAPWPTTYFGPASGLAIVLDHLKAGTGRSVGVVGLGAGVIATYGRPQDQFTFYEINPAVVTLARTQFTFLKSSPAQIEIIPGDARLALEARARRGEEARFDVLVLDAFNGDALPAHLLTTEAMAVYVSCLKPDGILVVNIVNRYLDLRGVVAGLAQAANMGFVVVFDEPKAEDYWLTNSLWCLLSRDSALVPYPVPQSRSAKPGDSTPGIEPIQWTDAHASLLDLLR